MSLTHLEEVLTRANDVGVKTLQPLAEETDRAARWPAEGLRALQAAGLGGLSVPTAHGGLGLGLQGVVRVTETLGQYCASTAMCFGMHLVGSAVIAARATPHQTENLLRPICRGEHLTTLALSEPGTGSHFYLPQTTVHREGDAYVLNGAKSFVTNGGHADSYVMSVVDASEAAPPGQFSCVVVPGDAPGLAWQQPWDGIGMRGNSSRSVALRGVRIPHTNLLGEEGTQTWYVFNVVAPFFVTAMAGTYLGVAQAALDEVRVHLKSRVHAHTGQSLSREPLVQHRVAALWTELEKARRLSYYAAEQGDLGGPDAMPAILSAKVEATETAVRVTGEALALLGGIGYGRGSRADRFHRDARAGPVMAPTSDMLRSWHGRWLLGVPLLSG
ncbi:MAG TPA: acyl-CoA dehydrogenase family protein [Candidatus Thermoplasmatota archaeon]|nr:acyl-CoA dehydrogenase family protein [Candidatus Thermoplasmatota archaeon]